MIRNKKAAEEGLTIWVSITVLTLAMIFFGIVTFISPKTTLEMKLVTASIEDSKVTLINYLRTPVGDTKETMQDMIIKWNYDHSTEPDLVKRTQDIFSPIYQDCYIFTIKNAAGEIILAMGDRKFKETSVSQKIPLPEDSYLTITFNPTYFYEKCNDLSEEFEFGGGVGGGGSGASRNVN